MIITLQTSLLPELVKNIQIDIKRACSVRCRLFEGKFLFYLTPTT